MNRSEMLVEYAKTHSKKEVAWFAQRLFGVDAEFPVEDGGPGSGNFNHAGRPGEVGGSAKGEGGGGGEYTQGQAVKSLGTVTRLEARRHSDRASRYEANVALEKAKRPGDKRIGSVKKVTTALPVGTIINHDGADYVKQHNGDWIGKKGTITRKDAPSMLENGGRITSVPKVTSYAKSKHNAQLRDVHGFPKGEMTDDVKAYTTNHGVTSEKFPKGMGVTRIDRADLMNKSGKNAPHTLADNCMEVNGKLVLRPEREALHQQIVEDAFEGKAKRPEGQKPHITILGGGPASGKGGFTKPGNKFGIPDSDSQVTIDPDEVKAQLPEYALEKDKHKSAMYAHEESSVVGKRIMEAAIQNGYDYTLDGTGDNSAKTMLAKIESARMIEDGTVVSGAYMTCPTDLAVERAVKRGEQTERYVPADVVASTHSKVSHVFPQIASEFDHVELYDSEGGEPKLIASCKKGEKIKVHDEEAYKRFLAKDQEKYDPNKDIFDPKAFPYGTGKEPSEGNGERKANLPKDIDRMIKRSNKLPHTSIEKDVQQSVEANERVYSKPEGERKRAMWSEMVYAPIGSVLDINDDDATAWEKTEAGWVELYKRADGREDVGDRMLKARKVLDETNAQFDDEYGCVIHFPKGGKRFLREPI